MKTDEVDSSEEMQLVFLPGLDGTGLSYGPLGEVMPVNARVTVVRYPVDQKLSFAELVHCAYEQLPRNKPFVLIAESFSGPIAISLASFMPTPPFLDSIFSENSFVMKPMALEELSSP
jgi:pimeloyl-ACP methyl ester carboxylesterase